jgi:hypothetical protein
MTRPVDLQRIYRVVARARRRLRLQLALEAATTAAIAAVAGALAILWLRRMEVVTPAAAALALIGLGAAVLVAAAFAAARRLPTARVATRIDRASGLADRLGTACDFSSRLDQAGNPETLALMQAAIRDGVDAAKRADIKKSAPFGLPRDLRALLVFGAVTAVIALLSFGPERRAPAGALAATAAATRPPGDAPDRETLDPDDLEYQRQFAAEMKELAQQTGDQNLKDMAQELENLLQQAGKGQITKQELLAKMDALEKKYSAGSDKDIEATLNDLKEQAKELKKQPVTKKLGEALEKGDMEQAQKELEDLADKLEKNELKPEDKKKLAEALQDAADKQEKKEQQREKEEQAQAQKEIEKKQDEIRRLEKKVAEKPEDEELKRTLQKEKRELEKLDREKKDKQAEKPKRQLERLTRNMQRAAENLRQKNEKQSADDLRKGAEDTKKVQDEMRRMQNQKRVRSQLADLKEAIRRAKPRKGNGKNGQQQARERRIREWEQRAAGGKGNSEAWKQGQGQQPGEQGKEGQLGQNGQQQTGPQWGTEHDPNLTGDPTQMKDKLKDEHLSGVQGAGPSRRETILTSAQKGFAHAAYRKVYADYKKIVEEVMTQEKVPQGYKYYVKRYFQRIKPHSMD